MKKLQDRVAIITGAAMGMGFGCSKVLAAYGANIVMIDIDPQVFREAEGLAQAGHQTSAYQIDVRNAEDLKKTYDEVVEKYGKIDILINAAGVGMMEYFEKVDKDFFDKTFGINFKGIWNSCRAAISHMRKANYGKIVNFASVTGTMVVDPGMTTYGATKGAVLAFTKALACEYAPFNVTVNAILPGFVDTPMVDKSCAEACPEDPQSVKKAMAANIPMKRLGTIEEVGEVAAFLSSDESSYVTGTHIVFDGGSTLPESPGTGWQPGE
ncbi:MAG: glucose 1-dehydrogenase [Bacillota bacterium]|jgi:NAD(P)-dependent dehydrogenase (short-subunit alcohol dehydrogenase family)